MNLKPVVSLLAISLFMVGCGQNKSSNGSNAPNLMTSQGMCSQDTAQLHNELKRLSYQKLSNKSQLKEIDRSCRSLQSQIGNNSCQVENPHKQQNQFIAYSDVANFCSEVSTYVRGHNSKRVRDLSKVRFEDMYGPQYQFTFNKSTLAERDFVTQDSQTRCRFNLLKRTNKNLRQSKGRFLSVSRLTVNQTNTYEAEIKLSGSNDLMKLTCISKSSQLTVQDMNSALEDVAQIENK